ncbi:MAG: GNAT family N-acetyltransferase [Prevotellaceae bacterium]|nr:GNAT family N-acetyltransferase [Prevotellaceae bacterium]
MEMVFREAVQGEEERVMVIMNQARRQMERLGSIQWDETYPAMEHIIEDIERHVGYVLHDGRTVIAYGAVVFTGEPVYDAIKGKWLTEGLPYVVLHRLAVAEEVKRQGIATRFMQEVAALAAAKGVHSFRVDTSYDNIYMQKAFTALGFSFCGEVYYTKGVRIAYEKLV